MLNKVQLIGRLGKDPEVKYTPDGTMITKFNIATDESWKDRNGERVQKTEWHRIVVWGKLAEICSKYLVKGKLVFVDGKLQTQTWDDKDGNKRSMTQIVAREMKMLDGNKGQASDDGRGPEGDYPAPDDDVPF